MDLELRHLRAFVTVIDEGSFTDAAAALHVSQASVSRAVAALESVVGGTVLRRTTRDLSLTPLGARVLSAARRMLEDAAFIEGTGRQNPSDVRIGHAWAAVGRHTASIQRQWAAEHPGSELIFVQSSTETAGLAEGTADAAVMRRDIDDRRYDTVLVGVEARYAALARTDPLARRRVVTLNDFAGRTIAVDDQTGTTTLDLWPAESAPTATRLVHGVEDWLIVITAGQAVGITAEATTHHHPRPGVVFRPIRDAKPVPIWLAWRRNDPPTHLDTLVQLLSAAYAAG